MITNALENPKMAEPVVDLLFLLKMAVVEVIVFMECFGVTDNVKFTIVAVD